MSAIVDAFFPRDPGRERLVGPIPFYGLWLVIAVMTFRSCVHFFAPDSGVNSIAGILRSL